MIDIDQKDDESLITRRVRIIEGPAKDLTGRILAVFLKQSLISVFTKALIRHAKIELDEGYQVFTNLPYKKKIIGVPYSHFEFLEPKEERIEFSKFKGHVEINDGKFGVAALAEISAQSKRSKKTFHLFECVLLSKDEKEKLSYAFSSERSVIVLRDIRRLSPEISEFLSGLMRRVPFTSEVITVVYPKSGTI